MKQLITLLSALLFLSFTLHAQVKIGNNLNNVNANALLELESTTKALLLPRLNQTQIDAMQNVPAGMLVYNSTDNLLYLRTNSGWTSLVSAANSTTATGPWTTSGTVAYTTSSKVGIGTSSPFSQLANTDINAIDFQGIGGNSEDSFSWASSGAIPSYVAQIYNSGDGTSRNGMLVKVHSTDATAFAVYQDNLSLITVKADQKVGINKARPLGTLDVNGNIMANRFDLGIQYIYEDHVFFGNSAYILACPTGTKLIGGGGGHRDANLFDSSAILINYSGPDPDSPDKRWRITVQNTVPANRTVRIYAICAKVQ